MKYVYILWVEREHSFGCTEQELVDVYSSQTKLDEDKEYLQKRNPNKIYSSTRQLVVDQYYG